MSGDKHTLYIGGFAVQEKTDNNSPELFYVHTDYLGNLQAVTNSDGTVKQYLSYGPWGRRRDADTWSYDYDDEPYFDRGYTGHEHLDAFGLINMNGRMYDPWVGRFLSPDNFVQAPGNLQNYNRYSYALNNPLIYTDPSGQLYLWDDVIVAGAGFIVGYTTYGLANDDWGWNAVAAGGIGAGTALLGYYTFGGGLATAQSGSALGQLSAGLGYSGSMMGNAAVNQVMPQLTIPVNDNLSFSVGPSVFFGDQTSLGLQMGATYTSGNWSFSAGVRSRAGTSNYGPSSFSESVYSGRIGWYDGTTGVYGSYSMFLYSSQQSIAGVGAIQGDWSFYVENDFFTRSGDKYRTHAMQLSYLDYSAGLLLYTGDATLDNPEIEEGSNLGPNGTHTGVNANKYRLGALYGGNKGFQAGWTSEGIRNSTQNLLHDLKGDARFAVLKDKFPGRPYFQYSTSYNYTLW